MARADEIAVLEDAFDAAADEVGETVRFGNKSTNWSNTNATNYTCIANELTHSELLEVGGIQPGEMQSLSVKKSALSNVAPAQQSTIARFRDTSYRVVQVDTQDALYLITLADTSD